MNNYDKAEFIHEFSKVVDTGTAYRIFKLMMNFVNGSNENYYYIDNIRIARVDSKEQMASYTRLVSEGCCGYFDEIVNVDNVRYKVGFNYGH